MEELPKNVLFLTDDEVAYIKECMDLRESVNQRSIFLHASLRQRMSSTVSTHEFVANVRNRAIEEEKAKSEGTNGKV